jgi:hypothetical protein
LLDVDTKTAKGEGMMSFYCNGMKGICTEMKTARYCPMDCKFSDGTGGHHVETNGDRIRSKNNGELAEFVVDIIELELRSGIIRSGVDLTEIQIKAIKQRWFNALCGWLKQPCEVDHDTD